MNIFIGSIAFLIFLYIARTLYLRSLYPGHWGRFFYIETSAINYLVDITEQPQDAIATRKLNKKKGNRYLISTVSIWEILQTSDEERREEIISFIQNAFHEELIVSPSEIIINFINAGCPVKEKHYKIISRQPINDTWKDICSNPEKTFVFDEQFLKDKSQNLKSLFKRIDKMILDVYEGKDDELESSMNALLKEYMGRLKNFDGITLSDQSRKKYKFSLLFIFFVLCMGVELDNSEIEEYWKSKKIEDTFERMEYVITNLGILVTRGPFIEMAIMAFYQLEIDKKPNRGLFWDCLHSIYLPYIDYLVTNDIHFKRLNEEVDHVNYKKILFIGDDILVRREVKL